MEDRKMDNLITIYHGSERIIEQPTFGKGKKITISVWASTALQAKNLQKNGLFPLFGTGFPIATLWIQLI